MYQVDEQPMETIHVYVVREGQKRPSLAPAIISLVALSLLIASGLLLSFQQPEQRETLRVPTVLLPLKTFSTSISVIPTGSKTSPAIHAHGALTITNGSVITAWLPKGLMFTSASGVEVVTDTPVVVPAGSATGYGIATVTAHALVSGVQGNIRTLAVDVVSGTALYIRNLHPFTGGQNALSTSFTTATDRATALEEARTRLSAQTIIGLLLRPCTEIIAGEQVLHVLWQCQFVTYHIPLYMRVTGVRVVGDMLLVDVVFVAHPRPLSGK